MSDKTYGYIKKRVLDTLDEYSDYSSYVSVSDTERDVLISRMPSALSSALIRMYESLPQGLKCASFTLFKPKVVTYERRLYDDGVSFSVNEGSKAVVFDFAGSGSVEITDDKGKVCLRIVCEGDGRLMRKADFADLEDGVYTVRAHGFITVRNFAVYEKNDNVPIDAYAPFGHACIYLPSDFSDFDEIFFCGNKVDKASVITNGNYGYFYCRNCADADTLDIRYRIKPPVISEDTQDDFCFDLPSLAIEALICLCASELCREGDSVRYTRLMYKYTDLAEGLRPPMRNKRNSFFKKSVKMRW